jgi:Ala-tRNA(Pro) deacylase
MREGTNSTTAASGNAVTPDITARSDSSSEQLLADGSTPATEAQVLGKLAELGIAQHTFHHPAVFTVVQAKALRGDLKGSHIKNLFLRNKKGQMWLITCHEDRQINLRALGDLLGAGRLSFASPERLMKFLGVIPGAVTALAVINDHGGKVRMVLDATVLNDTLINVHPLHNAATTALSPHDLQVFLKAMDHEATIVDMDAVPPKD